MAPGSAQSFWRVTIRNGKGGMGSVILPIAFEGVSSVFEKVEDKMKLTENSKPHLFNDIKKVMSYEGIGTYHEEANSELVLTVSYFSDRTAGEKYEMEMDAISTLNESGYKGTFRVEMREARSSKDVTTFNSESITITIKNTWKQVKE